MSCTQIEIYNSSTLTSVQWHGLGTYKYIGTTKDHEEPLYMLISQDSVAWIIKFKGNGMAGGNGWGATVIVIVIIGNYKGIQRL